MPKTILHHEYIYMHTKYFKYDTHFDCILMYLECLQHALDLCTEHMEMHLNLTPGFLPVYSPLSHQFVRTVV